MAHCRGKKNKTAELGRVSSSNEWHNLVSPVISQLVMGYFLGLFENVAGFS
jgi:hypothetical protein